MFLPALELTAAVAAPLGAAYLWWLRLRLPFRYRGYGILAAGLALIGITGVIKVVVPEMPALVNAAVGYSLGMLLVAAGLAWWASSLLSQQAQASGEAAQRHLRRYVDGLPLGVIEWDAERRITGWNRAAAELFGYSADEILGQGLDRLLSPNDDTGLPGRHHCMRKDGTPFVCHWRSMPLAREDALPSGQAAVVQDVSGEVEALKGLEQEKSLLSSLIDVAPGPFYIIDREGRFLRWNRAFIALTQYSSEAFRELRVTDVVAPEDWDRVAARIAEVFETGESSTELTLLTRTGGRVEVFATGTRVTIGHDEYLAGLAVDISDHKRAEQALQARNEALQLVNRLSNRLHRTLDAERIARDAVEVLVGLNLPPHVAFYLLESDGEHLRLVAHHGFDAATVRLGEHLPVRGSLSGVGLGEGELIVSPDIAADERLEPTVKANLIDKGVHTALVIPLFYQREALGSINLVYTRRMEFTEIELETFRMVGQAVSLAIANARHLAGLDYQAHHDALTGLPNRILLHKVFDRHVDEPAGADRVAALLLLDLNGFKEINDTLGHPMGDRLLKGIGPRLSATLEDYKTLVCRLGGDEFAVLLLDLRDEAQAESLARTVLEAMKKPLALGEMTLEIGTSVGVALYPRHGSDSHALLRCADVAMYQAKSVASGVVVYDSRFDKYAPERLAILADLAPAIRADQLLLHYQPQVDLVTNRVVGFEALVRWQHPELGLIPPDSFIPLAELSDAIYALTFWVVDRALRQLRAWNKGGNGYSMAINLSARNLLDAACSDRLRTLIRQYGVDPGYIEFELTESALMHDARGAEEHVAQIAATGARLSVDDFGTGYSSLSYLKRFPIHSLKIDRSFVGDMLDNEQSDAIVRSTINLARSLGIGVVAEGVEDAGTLEALRKQGCGMAQGYYIGRPMPVAEAEQWLANSAWGRPAGGGGF